MKFLTSPVLSVGAKSVMIRVIQLKGYSETKFLIMKKLLPLILISIVFTACNSNQESAFFDPKEPFEIVDIEKSADANSSFDNIDICTKWGLTKDEMKMVLKDSRVINGSEWHYLFSVYKCQYTGQIKQADKAYDFSVNAGSWFSVSDNDSTARYGNFNKKHDVLFIDGAWEED